MSKTKIINTFKKYLDTQKVNLTYIERFLGGMSNYTYHVVVNDHDYVIRIANHEGKAFVKYPLERLHLFLVEPFGITSKTLYYDTKSGHKISEYLPGHNLAKDLTINDYQGVAKLLHKLHQLPLEGVSVNPQKRLKLYERLVKGTISEEYFILKKYWLHELHTTYKNSEICFTHGDAQRSNIVKNDNDYWLLDFEFSGMNDPYFDLASFGNIDFNDSLILLDYYLDRPALDFEKRRVMFNRLFQVLQWHLVAQVKHEKGQSAKLHIDFKMYSDKYLAFAHFLADKIKTLPVR